MKNSKASLGQFLRRRLPCICLLRNYDSCRPIVGFLLCLAVSFLETAGKNKIWAFIYTVVRENYYHRSLISGALPLKMNA
jgi:hypothetical protein